MLLLTTGLYYSGEEYLISVNLNWKIGFNATDLELSKIYCSGFNKTQRLCNFRKSPPTVFEI